MAAITINKGLDLKLAGAPTHDLEDALKTPTVTIHPRELDGVKVKLEVKEGDTIKRGSALYSAKNVAGFTFRSPTAGTIKEIVRGKRRFPEKIIIEPSSSNESESFRKYTSHDIQAANRDELLAHLLDTGLLMLIRQRPFNKMADMSVTPKSIFVNAMNTAPFTPHAATALKGRTEHFNAGIDILHKLTSGPVNVCLHTADFDAPELSSSPRAKRHAFEGPHPSGNTSVHIERVDPMALRDTVWTIDAQQVAAIGQLFSEGEIPNTKVVCLGGHGIKPSGRKHYTVSIGGSLESLLDGKLEDQEMRIISGDVLSGSHVTIDQGIRVYDSAITVIPEGRTRRFLGWMDPGYKLRSFSTAFISTFINDQKDWRLDTNANGGHRAMVLTGYYDKVMPIDIMVDYVIRAVMANDTDEAVKLGILETVPEDYALCEFICPCKTNMQALIKQGLEMIEEEGI